jgi:protein-S-isoprenylcysteine O-methyltransferase Ste14
MDTALRVFVVIAVLSAAFQILSWGSRVRANALGKPPIAWPAFLAAKLGTAVSICLLLLRAVRGGQHLPAVPAVLCFCLLAGGSVILMLAFGRLGANLRMGLPREETVLVTSGIYGLSRNPLYLALFLFLGASVVYAFSWFNAAAAAIAFILHHRIVLAEERYLAGRFDGYESYRRSVRRYL